MKTEKEPSILDYLKSRLKFWDRRGWIQIPSENESIIHSETLEKDKIKISEINVNDDVQEIGPEYVAQKNSPTTGFPWRASLALLSAIFAQLMWEPQTRNLELGLALYAFAIGLTIWAILKKEWSLAVLPPQEIRTVPMTIRLIPFLAGVILCAIAFLDLGGNMFTWHNVMFWLGAVGFLIIALYHKQPKRETLEEKRHITKRQIITWSAIILILVTTVVFFRTYRINSVPSEPISDHAEKILDVYDVSQGQTHIFFPRNTGREAMQMYLTFAISLIFKTGLSFLSLKIGTVICGLFTLPYLYFLGREFGGKSVGLMAVFLAGVAYWPNIISRFGLRFPLYPLFAAPTLFYLIRGLRTLKRNDFIAAGVFLGFGLHGYTPFRIIPVIVVIIIGIYLLHRHIKEKRKNALIGLLIIVLISFVIFLPLARYWVDNPQSFSYRAFSRLGNGDTALSSSPISLFFSNTWNALRMFNWDDGSIWVISVPHRPALDVISGALFLLGIVLVIAHYLKYRNWQDLVILISIPLLELPSILSLAYPDENPALNRAGAALIPVFIIIALALNGFLIGIFNGIRGKFRKLMVSVIGIAIIGFSTIQNYQLVFDQYADQYSLASWNSSEMGEQIVAFKNKYGTTDTVWVVAFPNRVDTRLPGVWAGIPNRDFAIWPDQMADTLSLSGPKLFILWPDDTEALTTLEQIYPTYELSTIHSKIPGHDFLTYFIPGPQ